MLNKAISARLYASTTPPRLLSAALAGAYRSVSETPELEMQTVYPTAVRKHYALASAFFYKTKSCSVQPYFKITVPLKH